MSLDSIIKTSLTSNNQYISAYSINNSSGIYKLIDIEFKKDFIKKLYPDPKWTRRVYWNVIGKIQNENEEIPLDKMIFEIDNYLKSNNFKPVELSQRDVVNFIRDTILQLQTDNEATITAISEQTMGVGITSEQLDHAINHMKADGSIFKTKEGFYKCI